MADMFTPEKRSEVMSSIRSKWTRPELKVHNHLKGLKIRHKMHPQLPGNPDVEIANKGIAVFIHGCFWHKCSRCYREPKSRKKYWIPKINSNVKRDRRNTAVLRREGYKVVKLWEHEIKRDVENSLVKVLKWI